MTMTDVNTAFATERAALISSIQERNASMGERAEAYRKDTEARKADGRLVDIGGGRFRVNEPGSWDDNEVWFERTIPGMGQPLLLPQSGLAELDGEVKVYSSQPMWHGLGTVIPGGTSDISKVLELSGLDYDVEQRPVRYNFKGSLLAVPGKFVNVRSDTGDPFGVVGKIYTPVQNRDAFEFLQDLGDNGDVIWESAGQTARGRVFVSMKLPENLRIDAEGINDEIIPFVTAFNSHDGESPFQLVTTPWRTICGNTERFALRDAYTRWTVRHTTSATAKIAESRRTLGLSLRYYDQLVIEETQLAQTKATSDDVTALINDIWKREEVETVRTRLTNDRRTEKIQSIFRGETALVGSTAYAAERSVTAYLDHVAPRKAVGDKLAAARATAVLEGSDDNLKARAHAKLLTLRNA